MRGDGVLFHVLPHVNAYHRLLGVEQELGEGPGQLRLADAGRPEEEERALRPARIGEACRARRAGWRSRGRPRPVRPRAGEAAPPCGGVSAFALDEASHRDAGPPGDDLGDLLSTSSFTTSALPNPFRPACARRGAPRAPSGGRIAARGGPEVGARWASSISVCAASICALRGPGPASSAVPAPTGVWSAASVSLRLASSDSRSGEGLATPVSLALQRRVRSRAA